MSTSECERFVDDTHGVVPTVALVDDPIANKEQAEVTVPRLPMRKDMQLQSCGLDANSNTWGLRHPLNRQRGDSIKQDRCMHRWGRLSSTDLWLVGVE